MLPVDELSKTSRRRRVFVVTVVADGFVVSSMLPGANGNRVNGCPGHFEWIEVVFR